MLEPDVALTDYLLAAESALFAWLLWRPRVATAVRWPFAVLFASTSVAALAGGTVHGFFPPGASGWGAMLWRGTLLAIGVSALSGWYIGTSLIGGPRGVRAARIAASAGFAVYAVAIVVFADRFRVAVAHYLPAAAFMVIAFAAAYRTTPARELAMGIMGLTATLAAPAIQQFHVTLHPVYLTYNALYHLAQAAALLMIFRAARWLSTATTRTPSLCGL